MNPLKGFEPAPTDLEIVDVWPPGTLGDTQRAAYDILARAGRIRPVSVFRDPWTGLTSVRYLADIPAPWIHQELKQARYAGRQIEVNDVDL
jgi:hypothetical protein